MRTRRGVSVIIAAILAAVAAEAAKRALQEGNNDDSRGSVFTIRAFAMSFAIPSK